MIKSFVDLLFILLCGTIVMLSQSLRIGAVETAPAKLGSGGISDVSADEVRLVVVNDKGIELVDITGEVLKKQSVSELAKFIEPGECVLLTVKKEDVSHQRVMECWDGFRKTGVKVKLAATSEDTGKPSEEQ